MSVIWCTDWLYEVEYLHTVGLGYATNRRECKVVLFSYINTVFIGILTK